jgi:hypothetical protein
VGVSRQDPGETEIKCVIRDQKSVIDLAPQNDDDERDSVIRRRRLAKRDKLWNSARRDSPANDEDKDQAVNGQLSFTVFKKYIKGELSRLSICYLDSQVNQIVKT